MKFSILIFFSFSCIIYSKAQTSTTPPLSEFGLTFMPDRTFTESSLDGWHTLGDVDWTAKDGEIVGKANENGGWLILDEGHQDIAFRGLFKTSVGAQSAIILRMEKHDNGYRGILLSLNEEDIASAYSVVLDADGKEISRTKLRSAGGISYRMAPPPDTSSTPRPRRRWNRPTPPSDLPMQRPNTDYRKNDWNQIETFLETNVIRSFLNDGRENGGAVDGESSLSGYGSLALYIGGTGEVRFKDLNFKDISIRTLPKEETSPRFRIQQISDYYYSWGTDAGDFNRDGHLDIVSGAYIYLGPDFTNFKEIYPAIAVGPSKQFTSVNHQFVYDVNQDGWPDVITGWTAPTVYINPKGESRRWESYNPIPRTQSETTLFTDIDGDDKPELVYASGGQFKYSKPDAHSKTWTEINISDKGYSTAHGIGTGDINGDGLTDVLGANGWWEQPNSIDTKVSWKYHPVAFGRYKNRATNAGGSMMAVYDANGDGLNDVVSSLNAHGFGLAWFEQQKDANGAISFERHMVSDDYSKKSVNDVTFSQAHAANFADIDQDGVMDFVVGKRAFTHLDNLYDPDSYGPPVLYWYRTVRDSDAPGNAKLIPELIHNRSGAGSQITTVDLNKDGAMDLITATNRGTFIFWNKGGN